MIWIEKVLDDPSIHIRQRVNTSLGVMRLSSKYPLDRLCAACSRGLFYKNFTYKWIKGTLEKEEDKRPLPKEEITNPLPQEHENVRGSDYYQ